MASGQAWGLALREPLPEICFFSQDLGPQRVKLVPGDLAFLVRMVSDICLVEIYRNIGYLTTDLTSSRTHMGITIARSLNN